MVSVIITYNKDRGFLSEAIKSVKAQTYEDWELIQIKADRTLGLNINEGIEHSTGEYIKILAEDDLLTPDCLKILTDGIEDYNFIYSDGKLNCFHKFLGKTSCLIKSR